jgi:hypothetical protein
MFIFFVFVPKGLKHALSTIEIEEKDQDVLPMQSDMH